MNDYREALNKRDAREMGTKEWDVAQQKVQKIVETMVKVGSKQMVLEIMEEVYSLNDCGAELEDEAVKYDLQFLEENGFIKGVKEP